MGYNNGLLTYPFSKIKTDGQGDLQVALGLTSTSTTHANLFSNGNINPMAKYKPFCNSTVAFNSSTEREAARANARYGFSTMPIIQLATSNQNDWVYNRPTSGSYPLRVLDFVKDSSTGYDSNAKPPIGLILGDLTYDNACHITVASNDKTNAITGGGWVNDRSLSLGELLSGIYDQNISFLMIDNTDGAKNLVVTSVTARALVESYSNMANFVFYGYNSSHPSNCPGIPILNSGRAGRTFTIAVCLTAGMYPTDGNSYKVWETLSPYTPYSLGFVTGCDRGTIILGSGAFTMDGTYINSVVMSYEDRITEMSYGSQIWRAYSINVSAYIDTSAVAYSGEKTITGSITLSNGASYRFGPSPSEGDSTLTVPIATTVVGSTGWQGKYLYGTSANEYLWVLKYNGSPVSTAVIANVTYNYPFNNPISGSEGLTVP